MKTFLFEHAYQHIMFSMFGRKSEPLSEVHCLISIFNVSMFSFFLWWAQFPVIFFLNEITCLHINPVTLLIKERQLADGINHSSWRKSPSLAL